MTTFIYTSGNPANLDAGDSASMLDIQGPLTDLQTFLNSRTLNADNLPVSLLQQIGANDSSGQKARGKFVQPAAGTRANVAYGALSNGPDEVAGLVVPADSVVQVRYVASWQESIETGARAAIFIGSNQLKLGANNTGAPFVQEAEVPTNANVASLLTTGPGGLFGATGASAVAYTGHVTTGQALANGSFFAANGMNGLGGVCEIFGLPAGTYTISVQYKHSGGGTVTASGRSLWAEVRAY